ncbi:MAG: stage II sporulation protein D [Oscillospiraceae bacterium]|jgi:stage II sporulation protein D|nr:stage II sporulation protein D [Oscillospiraceae bacterium]
MKQNLLFAALLLALMIVLPVAALGFHAAAGADAAQGEAPPAWISVPATAAPESIPVMRSATGAVETVGLEEYLRGCVAAEIPMTYHTEALKAQAVASCTYARYRIAQGKDAVSDSGETDQAYLSQAERQKKWGDNYDAYTKKLNDAVAAVLGQQITYAGKPILAAFHAICSGLTENAADYWGGEYPYLLSVASPGDRLCPEYARTVVFTAAEIKAAFREESGVQLGDDPAKWFGKAESTPAGTVKSIQVEGKALSGQRVRALLGLRSANFAITYNKGSFSVKATGWGHGVGMSQYGADFMARQGSTYREILEHYYSGCQVG